MAEMTMPDNYKASYSTGLFGMYPFEKNETYEEIMRFDKILAAYFRDKGRSDYYIYDRRYGFTLTGKFKGYVEVCVDLLCVAISSDT